MKVANRANTKEMLPHRKQLQHPTNQEKSTCHVFIPKIAWLGPRQNLQTIHKNPEFEKLKLRGNNVNHLMWFDTTKCFFQSGWCESWKDVGSKKLKKQTKNFSSFGGDCTC